RLTSSWEASGLDTYFRPAAMVFFLWVLVTALFAIRLAAPPDLLENDQQRPAAYALDIVANGNWLVQMDHTGDVMSKPPFSTWVTALLAIPLGGLNLFTLYLPCYLATLGVAWMILAAGSCWFSRRAGLIAACAYVLSPVAESQIALARSDAVFRCSSLGRS
ncbi:MAG: hypothetical protein HC888_13675, partial [Candidatus Competibacteraceae bacterium]|nr:hypothetical protein [Candidatus Competibacteraceae bacterium]